MKARAECGRTRQAARFAARFAATVIALAVDAVPLPAPAAPPSTAPGGLVIVDDAGLTLRQDHPAHRIVTLAPHLTELVYAAGAGDALAAVGRFSDYPPAALAKPVIGDAFIVDYEALSRLHPDLILVWGSGTPQRIKDKLRALGWPVYESEIRDVAGLAETLRRIGRLAGTEAAADARAAKITADWAALRAEYAGRAPLRVFYQMWDAPLMTVNGQHMISSAMTACGGRNVFADLPTLTATVSWEAAIRRDPQLVATAGSPSEPARPGRWTAFPQVSATRNGQFVLLDGNLIARNGPRFVDGARQLCLAIDRARRRVASP